MIKLKELRKEKGLTQQELADIVGVSKLTVLRWEKGDRQIKPDKAQQLADYFGVPVGYLLGYSDNYADNTFIKYENQMKTAADFLGRSLIAKFKGEQVQEKIINNLRRFYDYNGEKMLKGEAKYWDKEEQKKAINYNQNKADEQINSFLYGLALIPDETRLILMDYLSLDDDKRTAINTIITLIASTTNKEDN